MTNSQAMVWVRSSQLNVLGGSLAVPVRVQTSSSTARMGYACLASCGTESVPILGMSHWSSSRALAKPA